MDSFKQIFEMKLGEIVYRFCLRYLTGVTYLIPALIFSAPCSLLFWDMGKVLRFFVVSAYCIFVSYFYKKLENFLIYMLITWPEKNG